MRITKAFTGLAGIVLGTSILSGCATDDSFSSWDALNIFAMSKIGDPNSTTQQQQAAANLSNLSSIMGQREHEMNVARESRDQVNVYYPEQNNQAYRPEQQEPAGKVVFVVYNYWFDRNGNGKVDCPNEYIGVEKQAFSKNEKIELAAHLQTAGVRGSTLYTKIYNPEGEEIIKSGYTIDRDFVVLRVGTNGNLMPRLVEKGGIGEYTAVWTIDNKNVASLKFRITE